MVEYAKRVHHIRAALADGGDTYDEVDIALGIATGQYQMWTAPGSIMITEIMEYPRMKACHMLLGGGNLAEIEQLVIRMEEWARKQGCTRVTLAGRKGWARTFLAERDYTPRWYVMAKELESDELGHEQEHHDVVRDDDNPNPPVDVGRGEG